MPDKLIVTDPVLVTIYALLPYGHRAARAVDRARDVTSGGRLTRQESEEIAELLAVRCRTRDQIVGVPALYAAYAQYTEALAAVESPVPGHVSIYRWDPRIDGPEPAFSVRTTGSCYTPTGLPRRMPADPGDTV